MRVIDASAILRSDLDFSKDFFVTSGGVLREVLEGSACVAVESAVRQGRIKVEEPSEDALRRARAAAEETGDLERLSETDLGLLALALEKGLVLVTDDYGIQNVAAALGLRYEGRGQDGIRKRLKWVFVCTGCGKRYLRHKADSCSVCGSPLRRKAEKS